MEVINILQNHCVVLLFEMYIDMSMSFPQCFFYPWYDLVYSLFMPFVLNSVCSGEFLLLSSP